MGIHEQLEADLEQQNSAAGAARARLSGEAASSTSQRLFVEATNGTFTYNVRPHDSLWRIAQDYLQQKSGHKPGNNETAKWVDKISAASRILKDERDSLTVRQKITLPAYEPGETPAPKSAARSGPQPATERSDRFIISRARGLADLIPDIAPVQRLPRREQQQAKAPEPAPRAAEQRPVRQSEPVRRAEQTAPAPQIPPTRRSTQVDGLMSENRPRLGSWIPLDLNAPLAATITGKPLIGKTIVIDAGHGGRDSGATYGGVMEKDINLAVALKVRDGLEQLGARVIMTREDDVKNRLSHIHQLTRRHAPDAFLSIHCDAGGRQATGVSTFYNAAASRDYANTMLRSVQSEVNVEARGAMVNNLHVVKHSGVPSTLVELGFLSNPNERRRLVDESYQQQLADALVKGELEFLTGNRS